MAHVQESLIILAASVTGSSGNVTVTGLDATNSYVLPTVTPGDTFYYSILTDGAGNWEFGLGTWTSAGNGTTTFGTFARTSPIKSKAGTAVPANFSGAPVTMIFDIPAEKALYIDGANNIVNGEFVAKAAIALDFADLVARKVPTANNIVFRIGYGRTQADGLGGFFIWKAGDATAADDHTTAVTVNTLAPAVGTGRYLRVFEAFVPASIADEAQIPTGGIAQSTATNELRRRRPLIGAEATTSVKTIPQVENAYQGSFATLTALLALASTKWRNGDRVTVRGIAADGDIKVPLDIFWNSSDTSTSATELGINKWRPTDISGGNAGRWNISAPDPNIKFANSDATPDVSGGEIFTCADIVPAAITMLDGFRDGKRLLVRPGAQDQVFTHSGTFVLPGARDFTLRTTDAPILFERENGTVRMIGGGGASRLLTGDAPAYGVTTAGAADETAAIVAELTAAALIGPTGRKGGVVTLPAGKILFTAQTTIPAGVTLQGLGQQLTELVYGGSSGPDGIVLGNRSTLRDLKVNGANLTTSTVICSAVQDALVERVYSLDAKNQGFAFSEGANRCRLIGCTAEGAGDRGVNIGVGAVTPAFGIGVYDFKAINCDDAGILLGHSVSQCIIDGFEIVGTDNVSLWLIANSFQNIIKNGVIRDPRAAGATNYGIWVQGKVYRNIISDIVVSGHQTGLCDEGGDHGLTIAADGVNGDNFGNIFSNLTLSGNGSGVGDGLLVGGTYSIGISNITQANPGVITTSSAHGLVTGDEVQVKGGGGGMTELSDVWVTVTVLTTTTFSIGINTTSYTAYSTGGAIVPHQVENELFSDIVINNFGVGIRDYSANIGRYNRFQNMQMFNVGSKISFNAVNYREQVFSNIDGVTNFGYLSGGDANNVSITPPTFAGGSPIRNPYPYPVFVYINHNGSGGTLGSVQILGRGQSSASGFNTAGAALFGNSQNGPYIIPPGGSIIVGISTGVAADYSWQWFSAW